jgi:type I restriction enzyme R subunit
MNEAETRAELIDPILREAGWGVVEGSRILREHHITKGRLLTGGQRAKPEIADYILVYNNQKIAVIEAKKVDEHYTEGLTQAKAYAERLHIENTYSTNGKQIYHVNMVTGHEGDVDRYPTPDELWQMVSKEKNDWHAKFNAVNPAGTFGLRYYQEIAVNKALDAIANDKNRILLTLATGTGKTAIAFQIAWKLFHSRWNINKDGNRRPRILFLADRNILADQAINAFSAFDENAMVRISPLDIRRRGSVPTNGIIFFTIFQTFMSGPNDTPYFGDYPKDFFDLVIIDECHRGGANDEGNWRAIMEHFSSAVQIGLTATPKRQDNVDTYRYFGEPLYEYSLKQGINDGFLTPFKVRRFETSLDEYTYDPDDDLIEGEIEEGKKYTEDDFNRTIVIKERELKRVNLFMNEINQDEKTLVFCANQAHALLVRDLINQVKISGNPNYCERVTANDGERGEQFLREFQDNEKLIPTILTTSQKLSTGVDARNIRNIVLMRPINTQIEFKQIIGRGTRLYDEKEYFTIYDFVNASERFEDKDWDGPPIDNTTEPNVNIHKPYPKADDGGGEVNEGNYCEECGYDPCRCNKKPKIRIRLADGKEREIIHSSETYCYDANGKPISVQQFIENLYGTMPEFCKSDDELRNIWASPITRKALLGRLAELGYGIAELEAMQKIIDAKDSDLFDVIAYISFATTPITRHERVEKTINMLHKGLEPNEIEFLDFVLSKFEIRGSDELSEEKLPVLLNLKYHAIEDAIILLGGAEKIRDNFFKFQKTLFTKL